MIDRVMAFASPDNALLSGEVRRRARVGVVVLLVVFFIVAAFAFIWILRSGSAVKVTHDQARTYAGILAQVIPVLILALYVDSTAQWSTIRARRDKEAEAIVQMSKDYGSIQESVVALRAQVDGVRDQLDPKSLVPLEQAELDCVDLEAGLQALLSAHKGRVVVDGVHVVGVSLQLLLGLFGEALALSSVLSPTTWLTQAATIALALLLVLFGQRLFDVPVAGVYGLAVQALGLVGFLVLAVVYVASLANVIQITVTG